MSTDPSSIRPPFSSTGQPNPFPDFPFGAVYFRKSYPPKEDWERDYKVAAEDGYTVFRHWFIWSAIEVKEGVYDWSDYDAQLDLAAKNGIKTVIADMLVIAPEWLGRRYESMRHINRDGSVMDAGMHVSCAVGGIHHLCLDNPEIKERAEAFLKAMVERYRDHPGLGGYDIMNECNVPLSYGEATARKFRTWLKNKYGDLETLGNAWFRHSLGDWDNINPPKHFGVYPDVMDWQEFHLDRTYEMMRWRFDLIRSLDSKHPITAHGIAKTFDRAAPSAGDDWRAAAEVESFGLTWGSCRHGDEPWKQFHAMDLVRAACRGKPFWHAESYAGPLWMAKNVVGKPRDEGRIASPDDIQYWHLAAYMAGASGSMYLRWRPLLNGPLFGAFGPYDLDGSRTERSAMSSKIAKWVAAPEQAELWKSRPVKGEIGIVYAPESQIFTYALRNGETEFYSGSMEGAYQGFFDNNIQADWVHIDDIESYPAIYLPFPAMLKQASADKLKSYVEQGGVLISEGCPGYFGDAGRVGVKQPNLGLDELFGVKESYAEFTPDLLTDLQLDVAGVRARGALFMQAYEAQSGEAKGSYDDGRVAAVDNAYGKGRTRLLGTMCGYGYGSHPENRDPSIWAELLRFAGIEPRVSSSDSRLKARIHEGEGGLWLWVANPTRENIAATITLNGQDALTTASVHWGGEMSVDGNALFVNASARNVTIAKLD